MRQSRGHVCQRPNIGSRVNREVHARFWERAEVRFLRATRHSRRPPLACPLRTKKRPGSGPSEIDAMCNSGLRRALFDHLVGAAEHGGRIGQAEAFAALRLTTVK